MRYVKLKPRTEANQSSTAKELSQLEASEEKWCANECDVLSRALTQPDEALRLPSNNNTQLIHFITGHKGYYELEQEEAHSPIYEDSDSGSESDDSEHSLASNTDVGIMVNRIAGDYNRQPHTSQPVDFCACQPDQVRPIQLGYIGGSPAQPEITFSLWLLRIHDALWRFCCIRTHPFAQALEFFHQAALGFVDDIKRKPRRWGRQLSCAVDAYRCLFQVKEDLESRAMELSKKEKLGINCPRCFGNNFYTKKEDEPDYVVCIEIRYPKLFLRPNQVKKWGNTHAGSSDDVPMHTAANDSRSASTWRPCDDTGLLAMVCRHNHASAFVNIVQSGEKSYFAHSLIGWLLKQLDEKDSTVGLLYNIGCNLEKGLI
ncbi:hypothetical protein DFH28DRAFT_1088667 [Melampsora americana]|nr:hypothetical protein DFH28DRAFT_1088667 [Melampsora americana]